MDRKPMEPLDPLVGPFYFRDEETGEQVEFVPVGFEESVQRFADCLGEYAVHSNVAELGGVLLTVTAVDLTRFIQADWDRVMAGDSPRGLLLASRGANHAAHRLSAEFILGRLLSAGSLFGIPVKELLDFGQASDRGLVRRTADAGSDNLVILLQDDRLIGVASKAAFRGTRSLRNSQLRIWRQLETMLLADPDVGFVLGALIDLTEHAILVAGSGRESFLSEGLDWSWAE